MKSRFLNRQIEYSEYGSAFNCMPGVNAAVSKANKYGEGRYNKVGDSRDAVLTSNDCLFLISNESDMLQQHRNDPSLMIRALIHGSRMRRHLAKS